MSFLKNWRRRRILQRSRLNETPWRETLASLPLLQGLSADEQTRLGKLTLLWLHEKSLETAGDLELSELMRLRIAVQACLPILNLGLDYYQDFVPVIVYPTGFLSPQQYHDAAGVIHTDDLARIGEAWERGPVILSWEDIAHTVTGDGCNVVIHEFAHKLDMLNGATNGMPPLHRDMAVETWSRIFTAAYQDFQWRLDTGIETAINPYAGESPAEFFAVASEAFFEIPSVLHQAYPDVYGQLRAFYRQHPLSRSPTLTES